MWSGMGLKQGARLHMSADVKSGWLVYGCKWVADVNCLRV